MNKYVLLIRNVGNPMEGLSESEVQGHMAAWGTWFEQLGQSNTLVDGLPFSPNAAIISNGNEVSNGMHVEDGGINVGGYVIINAKDLDDAIAISKGCPSLHGPDSTLEIRECMDMSM